MNIVSDKRRASARKHASRAHECPCGKVCHGNGGWSSHKRACAVYQAIRARSGGRVVHKVAP